MSLKNILFLILKLFLLLVVTSMVLFQIPELRYDFGPDKPVEIESPEQLKALAVEGSTFAAVKGTVNFDRAATFATHGLKYTYFMLNEYGDMLIVRTYETIDEDWAEVDKHVGRLKPYDQMPFSRSVRAGFSKNFDVMIADDAYFLGRDDVPHLSGWSIGASVFAVVLWCVLFYFFFVYKWVFGRSFADSIKPSAYMQTRSGD